MAILKGLTGGFGELKQKNIGDFHGDLKLSHWRFLATDGESHLNDTGNPASRWQRRTHFLKHPRNRVLQKN